LGKGSVIAAGSVVLKNVDPYTIVAGNPARFIRDRFPRAVKAELMEVEFSALSPAELRLTLDHIVLHK
jgi:virginiamycin A acetyltransferase